MKNKIFMCVIVFVILMINISCSNKTESNNIGLGTSLKDNLEDDSEDNPEGDPEGDPEDTDERGINIMDMVVSSWTLRRIKLQKITAMFI